MNKPIHYYYTHSLEHTEIRAHVCTGLALFVNSLEIEFALQRRWIHVYVDISSHDSETKGSLTGLSGGQPKEGCWGAAEQQESWQEEDGRREARHLVHAIYTDVGGILNRRGSTLLYSLAGHTYRSKEEG